MKTKGLDPNETVLRDIALNTKEEEMALWAYGKDGNSVVPANDTWKEWISGLVRATNRPDLDYYDFGEEYYFFDLENQKAIDVPTGNQARTSRVGDAIRNGLVLRLIKRNK